MANEKKEIKILTIRGLLELSPEEQLAWVAECVPSVPPEDRETYFKRYLQTQTGDLDEFVDLEELKRLVDASKKTRWLSIQKPWKQVYMFGVFLGIDDDTLFQPVGFGLGKYLITVGPHTTSGEDAQYLFRFPS